MPMKMNKPNLTSQLKSAMKTGAIPRAGAQRANKVGQVATNNQIVSFKGGKRHNSNGSGPKRGSRMY